MLPGAYAAHSGVHGSLLAAGDAGGVGDPALGERAERVGGGIHRRVAGPPDRDGGVGQQQRQHHRVGVLDHLAAQPDQRGLAGPARPCRPGRARGRRLGRRRGSPRATARGAPWTPRGPQAIASSACSSSATTMRVSTMPIAGLPALIRSLTKAAAISEAVGVGQLDHWSRPPPGAAVAGEHRVGGLGPPAAGGVLLRAMALAWPSSRGSGRGSARTARPPRGAGTAAGRPAARRGSAARRPPGWPRRTSRRRRSPC